MITLLTLPPELLSQILSNLPLASLLIASLSHPILLSISSSSSLSPFPFPIASALSPDAFYLPPPPHRSDLAPLSLTALLHSLPSRVLLANLAQYSWIPKKSHLEMLVRGEPEWVAVELELPVGLGEAYWQEAFRRRFLPSWASEEWMRKKGRGGWRGLFYNTIHRMSHRTTSLCSSDESYTHWLTLDRRGSSTINRIRSQSFDPLGIFHELKILNNLSSYPTTVREVVRLTDVVVLVVGVLGGTNSLWVNANGHLILHPRLVNEGVRVPRFEPVVVNRETRETSVTVGAGGEEVSTKYRKGKEKEKEEGGERGSRVNWGAHVRSRSEGAWKERALAAGGSSSGSGSNGKGKEREKVAPVKSSSNNKAEAQRLRISRTLSGGSTSSHSSSQNPSGPVSSAAASAVSSIASFLRPRAHPRTTIGGGIGSGWARQERVLIDSERTFGRDYATTPRGAGGGGGGGGAAAAAGAAGAVSFAPPPVIPERTVTTPLLPASSSLSRSSTREDSSSPTVASSRTRSTPSSASSSHRPSAVSSPAPSSPATTSTAELPSLPSTTSPPSARSGRRPADIPPLYLPYKIMSHPTPAPSHAYYPNLTPGGEDERARPPSARVVEEGADEVGVWPEMVGEKAWIGPMMIIAYLPTGNAPYSLPTPPTDFEITRDPDGHHHLPRHGAYASIGFEDLWAIAPWLKEEIGGRLEGGVGYLRASQGSEV